MISPDYPNGEFYTGIDHIMPYVQPDYWAGHTFGQGDIAKIPTHPLPTKETGRFVVSSIKSYLDEPGPRVALRVYEMGEIFDPNAYESGTVVAFKRERMQSPEVSEGLGTTSIEYSIPDLDTSLPTSKEFMPDRLSIRSGIPRISYLKAAFWGAVVRQPGETAAWLAYPSPAAVTYQPPRSRVAQPFLMESSVHVGEVVHTRPRGEVLTRFTALEVCTRGAAERKGSSTWNLFAGFAVRNAISR